MKAVEITDPSAPELAPYAKLTEAQLKSAADPQKGLFIAESAKVISAALASGIEPVSFLAEQRKLREIEEIYSGDAPVFTAEPELLAGITGYRLSRGVLSAMKRAPLPSVEETVKNASRIAVLEGIVDPENIGAIFRSAAALGMDAVLVCSSCCDPLYRRAARVSMGAVFRIPWTVLPCIDGTGGAADVSALHKLGFAAAALALDETAVGLDDARLAECDKLALLLGAEGDGLKDATVAACDMTVMIPMARGMDSLNVAAAASVAFWETAGKRRKQV